MYFHLKSEARVNCASKNKKNMWLKYFIGVFIIYEFHIIIFEVTAEEMELLYDKFKEDFLLFGYNLDFYKS